MPEKILIVDDDLDTLKLVGLMLQRQGYEIIAANSGGQGLTKAASEQPDLMLLDVMMPDMDGYEVTRRVRGDPALAHIPIIMFTAKTMVNDKVAGFEAGVDDYLTKPTHPAELSAHVKAVLGRASSTRAAPSERGRIIGFVAAKGGMGTTTLALNVGVSLAQAGEDVLVADIRPGIGALGLLVGHSKATGLSFLLSKRVDEINARLVEQQVVTHGSGVRLLMASPNPMDAALMSDHTAHFESIVKHLSSLSKTLVLDLPPGLPEINRKLLANCDQVILVFEPQPVALAMTKNMLADFEREGIGGGRVDLVMLNRERSGLQVTWQQAQEAIGKPLMGVVTPAPELAFQAAEAGVPIVVAQPQHLASNQIRQLAQQMVQRARPSAGAP